MGIGSSRVRWVYPILCFFITFLGGTLYSYSVIGYELQRLWRVSATEALVYFLFCFFGCLWVSDDLGDVLEKRFRSEKVSLYLGALLFGLGFTLAGFVDRSVALFSTLYFVAGLGVALMDSMTLPIATSWVLERPGLAVGIARAGFGLAPLVSAPLFEYLFKVYGFSSSLRLVGVVYLVIVSAIAYLVKMNPTVDGVRRDRDLGRSLADILCKKCFRITWVLYFAGLYTTRLHRLQ